VSDGEADVLSRLDGGVLWLTINRADAHNALTPAARDALVTELERAGGDLAVRAVVLTAAGEKSFCTGADLRGGRTGRAERPEGAPDRVVGDAARMIRTGWQRLVSAVLDCEKPVVAAVNGTAAGGGVHLALACDLVLAADTARFIEVFVRRGIAPDAGGAYLLARLVGPQKAKELVFFGDDLAAADAERIGLVNRVVPAADLEKVAGEWAARLAAGPTVALSHAKRLINRALDSDRTTAFGDEAWAQEVVNGSADAREGMTAFAERRPPEFRGW
jgi:2-(1,2-epoxy-1,2-dihydrophenyl)acetyl-CoA isomerase